MNNKIKALLLLGIYIVGVAVWANTTYPTSLYQASDTCSTGQYLVMDASGKRYKCQTGTLIYKATGVNLNSANTDVASIAGLPSSYIVRRVTVTNASTTPTLATYSLRTATGGGGVAIVSAQLLTALSATTKFVDSTLAITADIQTASTLTVRCIAANGSALTADFVIEITPLL